MIAYASRTGTRSTLQALAAAGWRMLISATGSHRDEGMPFAIDNGAFTAWQQGRSFDHDAFRRLLASHGDRADWVVLPDVVAEREPSLAMSMAYLTEVGTRYRWLLAVQDGMTPDDLTPFIGSIYGLAIGGSTEWKEQSAPMWGRAAAEHGLYLHMLRVNSARRINLAACAGCHSFDGTSVPRFPCTLKRLDFSRRQTSMRFV